MHTLKKAKDLKLYDQIVLDIGYSGHEMMRKCSVQYIQRYTITGGQRLISVTAVPVGTAVSDTRVFQEDEELKVLKQPW